MTLEEEVVALRAENNTLRAQVAALQEELELAQERIAELEEGKKRPPPFAKPNKRRDTEPRPPRRKRRAECNRGRRRETPTRVVSHALERCPDCGYELYGHSVARRRQVIDLPPPQAVEVTEHRVIKRWCPKCGRWHTPQLDLRGQVLGQGRIGVRLVSVIAYLRTRLRLPYRLIQEYLQSMHQVQLSVGELVEVLEQLRQKAEPTLQSLRAQMWSSAVVHMDETGWREDGRNGYLWGCSTPGSEGVRYYEYDWSRAHGVVRRLLGAQFRGILSSDFYGAYNVYLGRHQRCWAHLLRDLHRLKEEHSSEEEVVTWAKDVRALYDEAQEFIQACGKPSQAEREKQYRAFLERLQRLGLAYAQVKKHPCQALAKRVLRHQDELFLFVLVDGLSADNNLAERSLRPLVVARKISGGTRSSRGSRITLALASLF
nr:IS66 family transposase [Chloroflexota bacterium]